ncbi:NXPE family member 1-like isoform X2 [Podarcis muralis]
MQKPFFCNRDRNEASWFLGSCAGINHRSQLHLPQNWDQGRNPHLMFYIKNKTCWPSKNVVYRKAFNWLIDLVRRLHLMLIVPGDPYRDIENAVGSNGFAFAPWLSPRNLLFSDKSELMAIHRKCDCHLLRFSTRPQFFPGENGRANRSVDYHTQMSPGAGGKDSSCYRCWSNIGCNIPQCFGTFQVIVCKGKKATVAEGKCGAGMSYPSPSGFVWKKEWYPVFCQVLSFRNLKRIKSCLKRKIIYLLGDSTLRQWMRYITDKIQSFQYFDLHGTGKQKNMMALDMKRNSQIQWKKHNHPFVTVFEYMTADHSYIAREIDNVAGDGDTVVAVSLGHHFRPFPIELFIRRMINIRAAIQRLLVRSPDTKVIIKAENTREMSIDQERFGNFHGYAQYLVLKDIFRDLKVGFIDAWDMAIAYGTNLLHPPDHVVGSQIDMFLSYIC